MKKEKCTSKKTKKLRSAISMALVCVLLLSGATYAWFTLSNTSKVDGLSLKVTSEGSLKVAPDSSGTAGTYDSKLDWSMSETILMPCTSQNGVKLYKPIYQDDSTVSGLSEIGSDEATKYYLEKTIWLKMEDGGSANTQKYAVTLAQKNGTEGTFVNDASNGGSAQMSIRASFSLGTDTTASAVYEPNSDGTLATTTKATSTPDFTVGGSTVASNTFGTYEKIHKQLAIGTFSYTTTPTLYKTGDSSQLFELTNNSAQKVTIRVWFEGMDEQCANEIDVKSIEGQFKFIANKKQ